MAAGSLQGVLTVSPERIQAVDLDTISSPIRYTFANGSPSNYNDYFEIDTQTGVLKQIKPVDTSTAKKYELIVKAEEVSTAKRFTTAKLIIMVKPVDANPPVITATSIVGYVDENSAPGTRIADEQGKAIIFHTSDADLNDDDPKPKYLYELTTPYFEVTDDEGILIVNEGNLDRDPPSPGRFQFQVVAREPKTNAASAPLSLTVILRDINDNPPKLSMVPPVTIMAGDSVRRVVQMTATDNDEGPNALITYSIYHVSNNGQQKFTINERSGEIETNGRLLAGEQYSITVQATDIGGLSSQAIVEVTVMPGPNTKPPKFSTSIYEVQVSEGADINSTVAVIHAEDPENDPVTYSIVSGNDLRQFAVGRESGVIAVIRHLDRESLTRYQLIVKAQDNGGLSSSATVNIKVTDINDKNPEFDESTLPYIFQVDEGQIDWFVGIVHANDADEGINAHISYSIPNDVPFGINAETGEIRTRLALDYEQQKEYRFVVTAKDGAPDARLGTASVTVQVNDVSDEVPHFTDNQIDIQVPENELDYPVVTVKALDPDAVPEINYVIRKGDTERFSINANTGQIRTAMPLDYEKQQHYELIVGTLENDGNEIGDIVNVRVQVTDRNDFRPVFVSVPEPVTVNDDLSIGTIIATMPAIDEDGTAPGNIVHYEIVGRGKASKYFQIDTDSGIIRIRDELSKGEDTEYQIDIKAYDLGEPQLSSITSLPVYIRHSTTATSATSATSVNDERTTILNDRLELSGNDNLDEDIDEEYNGNNRATKVNVNSDHRDGQIMMSPDSIGLAFSNDSYTVSLPETTAINTTIKVIQVINAKRAHRHITGFRCELLQGNEDERFLLTVEDQGCGIQLLKSLDYENTTAYSLEIRLISNKYFINAKKSTATVKIIVQDENDNVPEFILNGRTINSGRTDTLYAVVTPDIDIDTPILQIRATDRDSGKYASIRYRIVETMENEISEHFLAASSYFMLMPETGILKTAKLFRDKDHFPIIFEVEARDNDGVEVGSNAARIRVVINQITDQNRLSLVFSDATPNDLRGHYMALEELLSKQTGGLIGAIERFSNRRFLNENGTVIENSAATDVWFYLIDPKTETILTSNATVIKESLLEATARNELNFAASGLTRATADGIYAPIKQRHNVHKVGWHHFFFELLALTNTMNYLHY